MAGSEPTKRRTGRASGAGGAFGLSSTRRAATLAMVVCALALSVAVPLRTYLSQRAEIEAAELRRAGLEEEHRQLELRGQRLRDPAQIEASSRERLLYARPGEVPYIVQLPDSPSAQPSVPAVPAPKPPKPWYERLWTSIAE